VERNYLLIYVIYFVWCLDYFVVRFCNCEAIYEVGWWSLRLWFEESYFFEGQSSDLWYTAKLEVQLQTQCNYNDVVFRIIVKKRNIFSEFY